MNKIIVQVYIPVNSKTYDVRVPESMYVHDLTELLADIFSESEKGFYYKSSVNILCLRKNGRILPQNRTLKELDINNRASLMFV